MHQRQTTYVLGSDPAELARLDQQAVAIAPPTQLLLQAAGVAPGMRVLDLGTGLGHVALMVGAMVGPAGSVVGVDQAPAVLEEARARAAAAGAANVRFAEADVTTWRDDEPFDAIVGRLVLFHMADPVAVLRHHLAGLRPGGLMIAVDFDIGGARAEPAVPLASRALAWIIRAFEQAGAHPMIGAHLAQLLDAAGIGEIRSLGVQGYFGPEDPGGPALVTGVVRSLADAIVAGGIAGASEIGLDTFEQRLADELRSAGAVLLPPTVVGAWGRRI